MPTRKVKLADLMREFKSLLAPTGASIAHVYKEEQGEPDPGPRVVDIGLHPALVKALERYGIDRLYKFQFEAYQNFNRGDNIVIAAGTGTGKTEAFIVPILDAILKMGVRTPRPYAIIMYPTKALARDQLFRFKLLAEGGLGLKVDVLDGDTSRDERTRIYSDPPHILVTNPDMMHYGLALSDRIKRLIRGYRVLVLDELHVYKGVFGSHVKWVIERMKTYAGGALQIIGAGATIGNPESLGEKLFGAKPTVIRGPRRRRGKAYHVMVSIGSASRWSTAALITAFFARRGLKTICFVDSQQMSELVARIARRTYRTEIAVHRAGLPAEYRREVEEKFRSGEIKAIAATPTMELGIDLGDLDVVVMATLPKSFSSYLQRAGRAGRRGRPGIIVTLLGDDPIESYFLRKPAEYYSQEPDPSYVEPGNPEILRVHAAAFLLERGLVRLGSVSEPLRSALIQLASIGAARRVGDNTILPDWEKLKHIVRSSSLRSAGPQVSIYEDNRKIGYRELPQAMYDLYPGAIYYSAGKTYLAVELDISSFKAKVRRVGGEVNFYTKPLYTVDVEAISPLEQRPLGPLRLIYADVTLSVIVEGYIVREEYTGKKLSEVYYDEPLKWSYDTKAVLARYPNPGIKDPIRLISGYHALEHAMIAASKPVVGASDTDLGGISYPSGHIIIYDSTPGGNGASRLVYERMEKVHDITENTLAGCDCEDGCPKCVFSPYCGNNNMFLSRTAAYEILRAVYRARPGFTIKSERPIGKPLA